MIVVIPSVAVIVGILYCSSFNKDVILFDLSIHVLLKAYTRVCPLLQEKMQKSRCRFDLCPGDNLSSGLSSIVGRSGRHTGTYVELPPALVARGRKCITNPIFNGPDRGPYLRSTNKRGFTVRESNMSNIMHKVRVSSC